jgi:hypothetical protein
MCFWKIESVTCKLFFLSSFYKDAILGWIFEQIYEENETALNRWDNYPQVKIIMIIKQQK